MKCPQCDRTIANAANSCRCGWKRASQNIPGVKVTTGDEDRLCAYVSEILGRCRYWGTISRGPGTAAFCAAHHHEHNGAQAERIVEESLRWEPEFWDLRTGKRVHVDGREVGSTALEQRARAIARRFNVDENLPPRERCMAIMRAFHKRGGVGGGYRQRERVPGEDIEEDQFR